MFVEVGAHGDHDDAGFVARGLHERCDELLLFLLVLAGGEQLFELVDCEHVVLSLVERVVRVVQFVQWLRFGLDQCLCLVVAVW